MIEFLTADIIATGVGIIGAALSMYAGFKAKMSVLEKAVSDLENLVTEMRQDIKLLIASNTK